MSAFAQLTAAIDGILPDGWKLIGFEPLNDIPDVTSVTLKVREISRLPAAPVGALQVDWILTVTSSFPSRETADPALFDNLIEFVAALDAAPDLGWLTWIGATKTVGDDLERLAYDITLRTHTTRTTTEESP